MAGALLVTFLVALAGIQTQVLASNTFFVSAPKNIIRGAPYGVSVHILNGTNVRVTAALQNSIYNGSTFKYDLVTLKSVSGNFSQGGLTQNLQIPIEDGFQCPSCKLLIQGRGDQVFERTTHVTVHNKLLTIFVQTDKAIYKPGQKVLYRAFAVYGNLKFYMGAFDIVIKDPSGNRLVFSKDLRSRTGVIEGSFQLSDQPPFGNWALDASVEGGDVRKTQYFEVDQYDLPRFEITIDLPPYGLLHETTLSGTVKAKYTFGEPVKGMVDLHVGPDRGPDHCGKMPASVNVGFEIYGEAKFSVPKSSINRVLSLHHGTNVRLTAFVTETNTGVKLNGSSVITYHSKEYSIEFASNTPSVFKPGLPYTAYVQVQSPDGLPPSVDGRQKISVYPYATYKVTVPDQSEYGISEFSGNYALPKIVVDLPPSGIAAINIDIPKNATSISMRAVYEKQSTSKSVSKTFSKSNNYIQLTLKNTDVKSGSTASFQIQGTEPLNFIRYEILSRGRLTKTGTVNGNGQETISFDMEMTTDMGPVADLITYYVRDDAEFVADSISFNVDGIFENKVAVDFSVDRAEPNTNIELKVSADPQSSVFILAVDQSVLLLKSGNDISPDEVQKGISDKEPIDSEFALSQSASTPGEVFTKSGLVYITDVDMPVPPPPFHPYHGGPHHYGMPGPSFSYDMDFMPGRPFAVRGAPSGPIVNVNTALAPVKRIRKVFPEAWLWSDAVTNSDGVTVFNTTVPDTITTWVASAFAANARSGLGVANKVNMTVFRSFFVSLNYPHTLKRNERAVIQATVFNYLSTEVTAVVTLTAPKNAGFHNIQLSRSKEVNIGTRPVRLRIRVRPNDQGSVFFPIEAKEIGVHDIEVRAQTDVAADGVRRQIIVEPEGAPAAYNIPIFVNGNNVNYVEQHTFTFPESTVEGSENINVGISGDLIGPSLDNLDALLPIPMGCGEQSMVKFVPNVYIAKYLEATSQINDHVRKDIVDRLSAGYQRQLTYRRSDASFSAFGNRDQSGSTWLTAYVSRTFNEARQFIYIDPQVIIGAVDWLVERQRNDGAFVELGRVIDPNTQGKETGPALTAACLLSLLQNKEFISERKCKDDNVNCQRTEKWMNATNKAIRNLEKNVDKIQDPFALSVVSYALTEARSSRASRAFRKLKRMSISEGEVIHWNGTSSSTSSPAPAYTIWQPPHIKSRPINILITSYALLTYTAKGQIRQALPIVRWLAQQRNSRGGFSSTQDTTTALQALSAYATRSIHPNTKLSVDFKLDGGNKADFTIRKSNLLNYQTQQLQKANDNDDRYNVHVRAIGNGLAVGEIGFNFHTTESIVGDAFDVNTVLLDDNLQYFNLMICTKYLKSGQTGMVVQEIEIPSGFEPDFTSIGNVAGMKRYERKGNAAVIYFDEIVKTSTCYSMIMSRKSKVSKSEKTFVNTFRYYSPEDKNTIFYHPRMLAKSSICDVCPKCCHGRRR